MSFYQDIYGMAFLGTLAALGIEVIAPPTGPDAPFINVVSVEQLGERIVAEREIPGPDVFADWRVTVVHVDSEAPICNTRAGMHVHEGWSRYKPDPKSVSDMHIDDWVGDDGCLSRMRANYGEGEAFKSFITWTPRDGRAPVSFIHEITS